MDKSINQSIKKIINTLIHQLHQTNQRALTAVAHSASVMSSIKTVFSSGAFGNSVALPIINKVMPYI